MNLGIDLESSYYRSIRLYLTVHPYKRLFDVTFDIIQTSTSTLFAVKISNLS